MNARERILHELLGPAVSQRQRELSTYLHRFYDGAVAAGPFQGMKLLEDDRPRR